jgi:membrane-associated PAP2 superfamily phosphatase
MQLTNTRITWISAAALAALLLWDLSGLDLTLAHAVGGPQGFALRDHWLLTDVLHTGAKALVWLLVMGLCLSVAWPLGPLRQLPLARRVQLAVSALFASALISLLKTGSHSSCPWDLHEFGGVARYASHWAGWLDTDGGAGQCFPAGHASSGFAFLGGYFAWRGQRPRVARRWVAAALLVGVGLGVAQQLRGAHFMSHTLWTGWLCWMTAWLTDPLFADKPGPTRLEVMS